MTVIVSSTEPPRPMLSTIGLFAPVPVADGSPGDHLARELTAVLQSWLSELRLASRHSRKECSDVHYRRNR